MGGVDTFQPSRFVKSSRLIFTLACVAVLAGGCNESKTETKADGVFDTSRLPRVSGAKEIFASPAVTNFTSPDPVAQTADNLEKALVTAGWQKYVAPNTAYADDPNMRIMSLKKDTQALNVFITVAPAQNNATSVQYSGLPLKTDLPFTKDASKIEYSPERALLTLVTAEPADKALDFYRKELGQRGWSLWSEKTNGKQGADGPSGIFHERGAYAHYITDKDPSVAMVLTVLKTDDGKSKVELKQWPIGILADQHQAYVNSDNHGAVLTDIGKLPRLAGAKDEAGRSTKDKVVYVVAGTLADTTAALDKLLGADGWKPYVAPMDERYAVRASFKKGAQAFSVSFTIQHGKDERTSEVTTVSYSADRLQFALAAPDDAADLVFDTNRPYLRLTTAAALDATRDFYNKQLTAAGWSPLSSADATAQWPNAKLDADAAYFDRGNKRPIMLTMQRAGDKTTVEIKVAAFALAQDLQADTDVFGLPRPKPAKSSGGSDGRPREIHAQVIADVDTVLAFYRRELGARNWKEDSQGGVITPDEVVLNFSPPEGSAVLKLSRKYDLTVVSIVQQIPAAAAKAAMAAPPAPADRTRSSGNDSIDAMMKQAQQMVRDATADAMSRAKQPQKMVQGNDTAEALRPLVGNTAPVPVPENAEDVEFNGSEGRLEFSSASDAKSVADFYRSTMKQQGWGTQSSVINNANMAVLNYTKAGKAVSVTVMKMGDKTTVTAEGPALIAATTAPAADNAAVAEAALQPATDDDLIVEQSGGLPVPKRHTLAVGDKSPFRRQLTANVPLDLKIVLAFYRRELGKLNWKEESRDAVIAADSVALAFSSADGPATLKLGRKDNETIVNLVTKDADAAAKGGVLPKPGQAKVLVTNPNDVEAAITINKQTYKVAAGGGTKGPDGAMIDLPPGKYKFSTKLPGKPASNDELEVGVDQTWGVLIGPGGALSLQVY